MNDEYSDKELPHEEWMLFVAQSLASELADQQQDIYSESDGEPLTLGDAAKTWSVPLLDLPREPVKD